jgi:hypothetical protein
VIITAAAKLRRNESDDVFARSLGSGNRLPKLVTSNLFQATQSYDSGGQLDGTVSPPPRTSYLKTTTKKEQRPPVVVAAVSKSLNLNIEELDEEEGGEDSNSTAYDTTPRRYFNNNNNDQNEEILSTTPRRYMAANLSRRHESLLLPDYVKPAVLGSKFPSSSNNQTALRRHESMAVTTTVVQQQQQSERAASGVNRRPSLRSSNVLTTPVTSIQSESVFSSGGEVVRRDSLASIHRRNSQVLALESSSRSSDHLQNSDNVTLGKRHSSEPRRSGQDDEYKVEAYI